MPILQRLVVENFRNIACSDISFGPGFNYIVGRNGAGKTSLLEAISVLSTGRSFRTRAYRATIKDTYDSFTLYCEYLDDDGSSSRLGVGRERGGAFKAKKNGQKVDSSSSLTKDIPIIVFDADSFAIVDGSSALRRRFIDWASFHVEHEYFNALKEYSICLKNRNALLKVRSVDKGQYAPWEEGMMRATDVISDTRTRVIEQLDRILKDTLDDWSSLGKRIDLSLYTGLPEKYEDLQHYFKVGIDKDLERCYTRYGPHRGDLRIASGGRLVEEYLSRGQKKILLTALITSVGTNLDQKTGKRAILLLDDVASELDEENREYLREWLERMKMQTFITAADSRQINITSDHNDRTEINDFVFHVEHGVISSALMTS